MRQWLIRCLVVGVGLGLPAAGAAQGLQPHAVQFAVGGDLGLYVPGQEFHAAFSPDAYVEFYPAARVSLRAMGAWARPDLDSGAGALEHWRASINVAYNWETGDWHPFVTAGGGACFARDVPDGGLAQGPWRTRGSVNVGGGAEYFVRTLVTFKFEATYSWAGQGDLAGNPSGLALSAGIKKYF